MAYEQRENSGSLFRNEKATTDRHPTHKGTALIGGVEYWISAWVKEGKSGRFFSLAFEPKEDTRFESAPPARTHHEEPPGSPGGDIPF